MRWRTGGIGLLVLAATGAWSQDHEHHPASPATTDADYADLGLHMRVTVKKPGREGDRERAVQLVETARRVMAPYQDYQRALDDGFKPFLEQLPLPEYHFTNYGHGFQASLFFDAERPTSLLYVREKGSYRLTGLMFTAPATASLEELDRRVPLSVAQWHLHTSLCLPPKGQGLEMLKRNPRFGFQGSIATREDCDAAGGRFFPRLFGWMVHVYPYEARAEDAFRMPAHHDHGSMGPGAEGHEGHESR
jgi:hypothetical protein